MYEILIILVIISLLLTLVIMKNKKIKVMKPFKVLALIGLLVLALSGCVKKEDEVYSLRNYVNQFQIGYQADESAEFVTKDIKLDTTYNGIDISWASSNPSLVTELGKITLPNELTKVTLTATFTYEKHREIKTFIITLPSQTEIDALNYKEAETAILVLETKNNRLNYEEAKKAFGLISADMEGYEQLNKRFKESELIYLASVKIEELKQKPNEENRLKAQNSVDLLEDGKVKTSYQTSINSYNLTIQVETELAKLETNERTIEQYNLVYTKIDSLDAFGAPYKTSFKTRADNVKAYLEILTEIENPITEARISEILLELNKKNKITNTTNFYFLSESETNDLNLALSNLEKNANQLKADLGESKVKEAINNLATYDEDKYLIASFLIENYKGDNLVDYQAQLAIIALKNNLGLKSLTGESEIEEIEAKIETIQANYDHALALNSILSNQTLKSANELILADYKLFLDISLEIVLLDEKLRTSYEEVEFISKYNEILNMLNLLVDSKLKSEIQNNLLVVELGKIYQVYYSLGELNNYQEDVLEKIENDLLTNYPGEYQKVIDDLNSLEINYPEGNSQEDLKDNLTLQTTGPNGSRIVWSSSLVSAIKIGGQVTPLLKKDLPNKKLQYVVVELTATVTSVVYPARFSGTKVFKVVVFASDADDRTITSRINFEPKIKVQEFNLSKVDEYAKADLLTEYGKKSLSLIQTVRININNLSDRTITSHEVERFYSNVKNNLGLHLNDVIYERANDFIKLVEKNPETSARATLLQIINENRESSMRIEHQRAIKHDLDLANQASNSAKILAKYGVILILILLLLLSQGLTTSFASKKGYEGFKWTLIASIPIFGMVYFNLIPKRRNVSKEGLRAVFKPKQIIGRILIYLEIVIMVIVVVIPVVYIFGMALSGLRTSIPNEIWPKEPTFKAFTYLFNETNFTGWYSNTLMIAFVNMIFGTLIITGASYVFARFSFKGKRAGLLALLGLQSFPTFMSLIAMYVLFWRFGLLGRPLALSIIYIGGSIPGNLWLVKGFLDQVPRDLDESAMIDGANKLQIFFSIILPLAIPILTFVAVNMFMGPWMDYMLPGYLLNVPPVGAPTDYDVKQNWTLAVGLFDFINNPDNTNYSAFAAGALMVGLPITILYMVFQKYLIEGIMAGATKG